MYTMAVKDELGMENLEGSPSTTGVAITMNPTSVRWEIPSNGLHQRNEVAIRRAISDISHHIDKHWNIDNNINESLDQDDNNVKSDDKQTLNQVKCECCGLQEDCTRTYITKIRETYSGKWVCGLCSEVMKETSERAPGRTVDQAMSSHRAICQEFNSTRLNPKLSLTCAMKNLAKRISEKRVKSVLVPPFSRLGRASSCVPKIDIN